VVSMARHGMRIVHRISLDVDAADRAGLARVGVMVGEGLVTFEVDEGDRRWPEVEAWIARRGPVDLVSTDFTAAEVSAAAWLHVVPTWHHGYPQPEDGYLEATYDLAEHCRTCGIGAVQRAPFRMKAEPRWGRNGLLQLNWTFEEYFATPEVYREVFAPRGVSARPVLDRTGRRELSTVVQLVVPERVGARMSGAPSETCSGCGGTKYLPHVRGPFPPLETAPSGHWCWTDQWFGSGASAHRAVLASRELVNALVARRVRGATFKPVAS
jgi:rRNA maturation protein Nop10